MMCFESIEYKDSIRILFNYDSGILLLLYLLQEVKLMILIILHIKVKVINLIKRYLIWSYFK
jgi:hypothetical protein